MRKAKSDYKKYPTCPHCGHEHKDYFMALPQTLWARYKDKKMDWECDNCFEMFSFIFHTYTMAEFEAIK